VPFIEAQKKMEKSSSAGKVLLATVKAMYTILVKICVSCSFGLIISEIIDLGVMVP
jgi:cobalamin-dependent methionine synthase I